MNWKHPSLVSLILTSTEKIVHEVCLQKRVLQFWKGHRCTTVLEGTSLYYSSGRDIIVLQFWKGHHRTTVLEGTSLYYSSGRDIIEFSLKRGGRPATKISRPSHIEILVLGTDCYTIFGQQIVIVCITLSSHKRNINLIFIYTHNKVY